MEKQLVIIVVDKLEIYSALFKNIKEISKYTTIITSVAELLDEKMSKEISAFRSFSVFLAIEKDLFKEIESQIRSYFQDIFNAPFTNILNLYTNVQEFKNTLDKNKEENSFLLYPDYNPDITTTYLHMYLNDLFNKATVAYRLSDYIFHSFESVVYSELLKMKKKEVEDLNKELERRNRIDPLTNLFNRRALFEFLDKERSRAIRNLFKIGVYNQADEKPHYTEKEKRQNLSPEYIEGNLIIFSIMMIDLDNFKLINDTYGHLAGDTVLKTIGNIFQQKGILREQDIVGRFGGEEFIVILPGTSAQNSRGPAKRLSQELAKHTFKATRAQAEIEFQVTMSMGISEYMASDKSGDDIVQRADKALYIAKDQGRDQIIVYEDAM